MWNKIYMHLKNKGIDIYSPGQKKGSCDKPYVVLKDTGQHAMPGTNKLGYSLIDVIIFYPINQYSKIEGYKKQIKSYMKELEYIKPTGTETPVIIDESVNAYTISVEYQIQKKL